MLSEAKHFIGTVNFEEYESIEFVISYVYHCHSCIYRFFASMLVLTGGFEENCTGEYYLKKKEEKKACGSSNVSTVHVFTLSSMIF